MSSNSLYALRKWLAVFNNENSKKNWNYEENTGERGMQEVGGVNRFMSPLTVKPKT